MVYELRCYTLKPGKVPEFLRINETLGRPIRGQKFGENLGYWTAEFGALNQVWHLWRYESYSERSRLRGELAKHKPWTEEYIPIIKPLIAQQALRLMNAVVDIKPSDSTTGNAYELRIYRTQMGAATEYAKNFKAVQATREKYSPIWGAWIGEFPQPNEWLHLWRYKNLEERFEARAAVSKNPEWQAYVAKGASLLVETHSTLLLPVSFSPLQ